MKRRIFTTLDNIAKRDIFDAKYAQLEKRREALDKQIRREEREAKIVLAKENVVEFTNKAKKSMQQRYFTLPDAVPFELVCLNVTE